MARPSNLDPLEKFRFSVTVLSVDLSLTAGVDALAGALSTAGGFARDVGKVLSTVGRAGFSEITLPSVAINEISYRENIDNQRFSKIPGLSTYTPVVLRRGATDSRDLYNWYRLVNDDLLLMSTSQELGLKSTKPPIQVDNFRKEVIINVHNRDGDAVKQWILFNAFPTAYKGGNDLSAQGEDKLIEEITLSYEFFLELEGGADGFAKELARDAIEDAVGNFLNDKAPPFLR